MKCFLCSEYTSRWLRIMNGRGIFAHEEASMPICYMCVAVLMHRAIENTLEDD